MALPLLGHLTDVEPYVYALLIVSIELSGKQEDRVRLVGFKARRSLITFLPSLPHLFPLNPYSPIFPAASLLAAQYELVKKTNMVDYAQQLFETINPGAEAPAGSSFFLPLLPFVASPSSPASFTGLI